MATGDMETYRPEGRTLEDRWQDILRRRDVWQRDNPGKACIVVVHTSMATSLGYWLGKHGIAWTTMPGREPLKGEVRLAGPEEVGA